MKPPSGRDRRIGPAFLRQPNFTTFTRNEQMLLNLIRNSGGISRADMARQTDLAMQSVVRLIDGLIARGVVAGGEKVIRGPGQPSLSIRLVPDAAFAFGVSISTDAVSIMLMDLAGRVRASNFQPMDVSAREAVVDHIRKTLACLLQETQVDRSRVFGVGVATTGYFIGSARINTPSTMGAWALQDLEEQLAEAFDLPVWVENDGNAAAAGESLYGAGQRYKSFAYVYVAMGLGGGLVLDGALVRGFCGNAGELTGLLAPGDRPNRPTLSLLMELVRERGVEIGGVAQLAHQLEMGWPGVETWLERTRAATTAIVSSIAAIMDPEAIIIGGLLPRPLATELAKRVSFYEVPLRDRERPFPVVLAAEAPGDAATLGAAAIPLKEHFFG